MESRKMEIIKELMEELQEEMQYGEDDFATRLGREKPKVEVAMVEGNLGGPEIEADENELGMDLDGDEEMGEPADRELKKRLMKLRG